MTKTTKKTIKIVSVCLAALLAACIILALVAILPQLRKKGTRYDDTVQFNNGAVQMIAHRGLSGLALENSVAAFEEAGKRSYFGIEADVHVTKDGKFIITHDNTLARIAEMDLTIADCTYEELRGLRFKDVYGESEEKECFLPSLEEYILVCKQYDKQAILELKNEMPAEKAQDIARQVEALGWLDRTTFISFAKNNLIAVREMYPNAAAQYLVQNVKSEDIDFMIENKIDGSFCWIALTPSRVRRLHNAGLKAGVWTVDGTLMAWWAKTCGVDYITTNILE